MTYEQTLTKIHQLGRFGGKPGLERMRALCGLLGDPQKTLRVIHIAGTNGKGSMTACCAEVLAQAGYRVGRFVSPFVEDFCERISINGTAVGQDALCDLADEVFKVLPALEELGFGAAVEFEFITAMGFLHFARSGCDFVVLEVGLGGRLDATNVVEKPLVSVIGRIDFDHTELLGNTYAAIAYEKCGIIKPGCPVVCYPLQEPSAAEVIGRIAAERGCALASPDMGCVGGVSYGLGGTDLTYRGASLHIGLVGPHQVPNFLTALEALQVLRERHGVAIPADAVDRGFRLAAMPARFEILCHSPLVILDGAHNPAGMDALCDTSDAVLADTGIHAVFGCVSDKNPRAMLERLIKRLRPTTLSLVDVPSPRLCPKEELAAMARELSPALSVSVSDDIERCLRGLWSVGDGQAVVCLGSLYLAGDVKRAVRKISALP